MATFLAILESRVSLATNHPPAIPSHTLPTHTQTYANPCKQNLDTRRSYSDTVTVFVDGKETHVPKGVTVLQACEQAGVDVPRFCYHQVRVGRFPNPGTVYRSYVSSTAVIKRKTRD